MSDTHARFVANSKSLLELAVEALSTAPRFTAAQVAMRRDAVFHGVLAFVPTEPVQTMLAADAVAFHLSVMDSFQEINQAAAPLEVSARARAGASGQAKTMLALMRKFRLAKQT